jgi:hypothetical protein
MSLLQKLRVSQLKSVDNIIGIELPITEGSSACDL